MGQQETPETPKIVLGTQYGTEVQQAAIEFQRGRHALAAEVARRATIAARRKLTEDDIKALMMPDHLTPGDIERAQAQQALDADLVDLQPPQGEN